MTFNLNCTDYYTGYKVVDSICLFEAHHPIMVGVGAIFLTVLVLLVIYRKGVFVFGDELK
jgi:hypothetical protein